MLGPHIFAGLPVAFENTSTSVRQSWRRPGSVIAPMCASTLSPVGLVFASYFCAGFFATVFFATGFFGAAFLAATFFAAGFFAAAFLGATFFATGFFAAD